VRLLKWSLASSQVRCGTYSYKVLNLLVAPEGRRYGTQGNRGFTGTKYRTRDIERPQLCGSSETGAIMLTEKESTRALWRPVTCGPPQDRGATQTSLRHLLTPALSLPETVRLPVEDQDVRPVRDAVQQRRGQSGVPEHLLPAGKLQVAGDDEAVSQRPPNRFGHSCLMG